MSTRDVAWPAGTPNWIDLTTSDPAAAWSFYSSLFGWEVTDTGEASGHYGMARLDGRLVAGLGGTAPDDGSGSHWTAYIATDDVDATAEAITANGGTVVFGPLDVMEAGRMAVAQDAAGAFFGVWQAGTTIGTERVNEPGSLVWTQLNSSDLPAAEAFYAAVFGYEYKGDQNGTMIVGDGPGDVIGGMGPLDDASAGVPSHWAVYFAVASADATAARIEELGGRVLAGPVDMPFGRLVAGTDPQGAAFAVISQIPGGEA